MKELAVLKGKQKRFCEEFIIDLNGAQAAIRAGYSKKTAKEMGWENLTKPHIQSYVSKLLTIRSQKVNVDAEWVLKRLVEVAERSLEATPVKNDDGDDIGEYKFNSSGANKSLELIGKHCGMWPVKEDKSSAVDHSFLMAVTELMRTGMTKESAVKKVTGE